MIDAARAVPLPPLECVKFPHPDDPYIIGMMGLILSLSPGFRGKMPGQ